MAEASYTAKDITVLEGLEPVRLRPGTGVTPEAGLSVSQFTVVLAVQEMPATGLVREIR